jgi:hypothetical protein
LSSSNFIAALKETTPGKEFDLEITAVPPFTQPTTFASLPLKTSATNAGALNVTAYATVVQAITVSPAQIMLPPGPITNPVTANITVFYRGTNTLQLSDPKINLPGAEATIQNVQTGKVFVVKTTIPAGVEIKPGESYMLEVSSDYPKQPKITVLVRQQPVPVRRVNAGAVSTAGGPAIVPAPASGVSASPRTVPVRRLTPRLLRHRRHCRHLLLCPPPLRSQQTGSKT